ncbi:hypothetical protein K438DRAFT_1590633 [Mycena galopus ATCC 62051]|nr:hypothetical protein K438DRAFT_1590633 [Mycena galopus ATCC 62051]
MVCVSALVEQEEALRAAQAGEALRHLRAGLRTRVFAHRFKCKNFAGQGAYTKTRELVDGIEDRVRSAAMRYRAARTALLALRGPGAWENELQELKKEDIRGMNERALNDEEKEENRKARLLAGLSEGADGQDLDEYGEPVELTVLFNLETGEGRRQLSWIWYAGSIRDSDVAADGSLHAGMSFCFLQAFCAWKARWWEAKVAARPDVAPELAEGLRAYALLQVAREQAWESEWRRKWAAVRERAQMVMRVHVMDMTDLVPLEVELDDEMEEDNYNEDTDGV